MPCTVLHRYLWTEPITYIQIVLYVHHSIHIINCETASGWPYDTWEFTSFTLFPSRLIYYRCKWAFSWRQLWGIRRRRHSPGSLGPLRSASWDVACRCCPVLCLYSGRSAVDRQVTVIHGWTVCTIEEDQAISIHKLSSCVWSWSTRLLTNNLEILNW